MDDWQVRYAHVYACLDDEQRRRVLSSIQNSVIEGFEPTEADVLVMVRLELGEITSLEAMEDVASRRGPRARMAPEEDQ